MYSDRLQQDGYRVVSAADGLEALSILRSDTPDLILLDLVMPKMSGLEILDLIKRDPRLKNIPVMILSNLGQDADIQRGLEMGAFDYMIKNDVRPADVSEKIKSVLGATSPTDIGTSFRLIVRDREADADGFVEAAGLPRRFWCPACEVELNLEVVPQKDRPGWYEAHLICPMCAREY
jgi:CheY-like chemotaxis protein